MPAWFADPEQVARDLTVLATAYSCAFVKILGGEPLLHPRLPEIVEAVRASGITDHVAVATNGLLLERAEPRLWSVVDEFKVSVYPGSAPSPEVLERLRRRAEEHGVRLDVTLVPVFHEPYAEHLPPDGVPIQQGIQQGEDFLTRLHSYLTASEGPAACRWCLGTVGRRRAHAQLARPKWQAAQDATSEELVDPQLLADPERGTALGTPERTVLGTDESAPTSWARRRRRGDATT
ncbi:hypothetical protein SSP35_02_03140 [Streptomyces sp. NBRC 110611]|nr:hypothetical protein SSP35_02_03140 [Streptomyces sp. NBRC 110611]